MLVLKYWDRHERKDNRKDAHAGTGVPVRAAKGLAKLLAQVATTMWGRRSLRCSGTVK